MMWVIDRKNLKVIEVPDDYRECSTCFAWKPESDFKREGEDYISRTNCHDCFMLPYEDFKKARDEAVAYKESLRENGKLRMAMRALETELKIRKNGITKDKLRDWFAELLNQVPDDALIDIGGGDLEMWQSILGKPLYTLKFSEFTDIGY